MAHLKTYFILPTTVYKPDDYIQLGQVITDPRKPYDRLASPLPLTGSSAPRKSSSSNWSFTRTQTEDSSAGVFANFINILTAEASGGKSGAHTQSWKTATLETQYFEISEDPSYVERTAKVPAVEKWLKKHRHLGKTVYMIAGVKIAKLPGNVTYDSSGATNMSAKVKGVVDPKGLLEAGGEVNHQKSADAVLSETPETSYVVAYRLRRLRVSWRHGFKVSDYQEGADLHGIGRKSATSFPPTDEDTDESWQMESISSDNNDFGASLPAKDKKIQGVDEAGGNPCLLIRAAV